MKPRSTLMSLATAAALMSGTAVAQADPTRILVIPFAALNVPDSQQYLAKAPVETIVADLGKAGPSGNVSPIAFQGQLIVEDNATAARLARQANAAYAIRGSVQTAGDTVRLTAQLIDARTADTLNTATVTGPVADFLKLEDQLSLDIRGAAPGNAPAPATAATPPLPPATTPPAPAAPQIVIMPPSPAYFPTPAYYPAYASESYYPYGYSSLSTFYPFGFYPGFSTLVITRVDRDHHHDNFDCNDGHDGHHNGNHGIANPIVASSGPSGGPLVPFSPPGGLVPSSPPGGLVPSSPPGGLVPTSAGTFGGVIQPVGPGQTANRFTASTTSTAPTFSTIAARSVSTPVIHTIPTVRNAAQVSPPRAATPSAAPQLRTVSAPPAAAPTRTAAPARTATPAAAPRAAQSPTRGGTIVKSR